LVSGDVFAVALRVSATKNAIAETKQELHLSAHLDDEAAEGRVRRACQVVMFWSNDCVLLDAARPRRSTHTPAASAKTHQGRGAARGSCWHGFEPALR
jgi:hypothetical protein